MCLQVFRFCILVQQNDFLEDFGQISVSFCLCFFLGGGHFIHKTIDQLIENIIGRLIDNENNL